MRSAGSHSPAGRLAPAGIRALTASVDALIDQVDEQGYGDRGEACGQTDSEHARLPWMVPIMGIFRSPVIQFAAAVGAMPEVHRKFLVSFERGKPDWPLLGIGGVAELPAARCRQRNLDKLGRRARAKLVERLREALDI